MIKSLRKSIAVFLSLIFILIPISSYAAQGTLGSETPHLYCSFTNSENGEAVDGNILSAGTYDVSFYLSGMKEFAAMQFTSSYDEKVLQINSYSDLLSDSVSDIDQVKSIGVIAENGKLYTGFVASYPAACAAIHSEGQLLLKLNVTVTTAGSVDFADVVTLDTHPQRTFIEADYRDYEDYLEDNHDCYALADSVEGYSGKLWPMTADLSPAVGYSVTGTVLALANTSGKLAGDAFTVIGCDIIINGEVVATTDADGVFTIPQLATGTYTATLSYAYGFDRDITIAVTDGAVDLGKLGMVVCNFSKDGKIDGTDYNTYKRASGKSNGSATYNAACDFNHDGKVDGTDYNIYKAFSGKLLSSTIYD